MGAKSRHNVFDTIFQVASEGSARGLGHLNAMDGSFDGRFVELQREPKFEDTGHFEAPARPAAQRLLNFGSCSYLGLERHPAIVEGIETAARRFGSQFSSSRAYVSLGLYEELEASLFRIFERPALATPTTTLGHFSALPVLIEDGDAIILDQQVHHSVQTAAQLLKARNVPLHVVRHNRLDRLDDLIIKLKNKHRRIWYLADGVYSMYGDAAPARELYDLLDRHPQLWLYVDDAHGVSWRGTHGRGYFRSQVDVHHSRLVLTASLNKSFASSGGAVIFPNQALFERVRACGPTMIFSGPIQPPMLGAAVASTHLHLSDELPALQAELAELIAHTNERLDAAGIMQVRRTDTPLFFIPVGLPRVSGNLVEGLLEAGCYTNLGCFPAVPMKQGGIRFTVNRGLTKSDIDQLVDAFAERFEPALAAGQSSPNELRAAFRLVGLHQPTPPAANDDSPAHGHRSPGTFVVERYASARELDPKAWNPLFRGRGPLSVSALAAMEEVFVRGGSTQMGEHAEFRYLILRDGEEIVVAAPLCITHIKDDTFAPASVSQRLEAERREGKPDHLVSKAVALGTPLGLGSQLYLRREHPGWREALARFVRELQALREEHGATQILLRDFCRVPGDVASERRHEELRKVMMDLGLFEFRLPNMMTIDSIDWKDRDGFLAGLGQKYRYNVRKEILKHEEEFIVRVGGPFTGADIDACYELYRSVHARSFELNVFPLPRRLFEVAFDHPEYEVLRLYLRDQPETGPVAVLLSHIDGGTHTALLIGLDDATRLQRNCYKQALFQAVERAQMQGCTRINLAFTAELEKKKLGARPVGTFAFIQAEDDFAATVMQNM